MLQFIIDVFYNNKLGMLCVCVVFVYKVCRLLNIDVFIVYMKLIGLKFFRLIYI